VILHLAIAAALAGEMDAPELPKVAVDPVEIPEGPPRELRVAPGEDLAAAIRSLPAGSRLVLAAGRHQGPLVADRGLSVVGEPGAVVSGGGQGSVVIVAADDVTLSGFAVEGSGSALHKGDAGIVVVADRFRLEDLALSDIATGIDLRQANDGVVTRCTVQGRSDEPFGMRGDGLRLWESYRNHIVGNTLEDVRDMVIWYSDHNVVAGNTVRRSRYGTHFMHTGDNLVVGNQYLDDVVGIFVMYSERIRAFGNRMEEADGAAGVGIGLKESNDLALVGNLLLANTTGLYVDSTPHRRDAVLVASRNLIAGNELALRVHGSQHGVRFTGNVLSGNGVSAAVDGHGDLAACDFGSNEWSDYVGYDLDRDGAGDVPYEASSLSGSLRDRQPKLAFFSGTVAAGLLDLFGAAFPMWAPDVVLTDPTPRMDGGLP
jgi:nitrous oxidase accessory protein